MPIAPTFGDQTDLIIAVGLGGCKEKVLSNGGKEPKKPFALQQELYIHEKIIALSRFKTAVK